MRLVRGLMTQQIPVRTGIKKCLIAVVLFLPDGKRYRTIGILCLDLPYQGTDFIVCKIRIFPALQHKGPKSQFIPICTTGKNFFLRQAIAFCLAIALSNATVNTVILTVIGEFNQSTDKHLLSVNGICCLTCPLVKKCNVPGIRCLQQQSQLFTGYILSVFNFRYDLL